MTTDAILCHRSQVSIQFWQQKWQSETIKKIVQVFFYSIFKLIKILRKSKIYFRTGGPMTATLNGNVSC